MPCEVCAKSKPNTAKDRGALPIPQLSNDILYIDFVAMDEFNNQDYVLAIVDGLTPFVQYIKHDWWKDTHACMSPNLNLDKYHITKYDPPSYDVSYHIT